METARYLSKGCVCSGRLVTALFAHCLAERPLLTLPTYLTLEGVANLDSDENEIDDTEENDQTGEMSSRQQPKLQNSIAGMCTIFTSINSIVFVSELTFACISGLITRFLPAIEAFFMVNMSPHSGESEPASSEDSDDNDNLRVVQFAAGNKILL